MKPIRRHQPRNMTASDMANTAASHFVPLGHVAEDIVRRAYEMRQNHHGAQVRTGSRFRPEESRVSRREDPPGSAEQGEIAG